MNYSIFDACLESILVLDAQKNVVYGNEAVAQLTGVRLRKFLSSQPLAKLIVFKSDTLPLQKSDMLSITHPTPYEEVSFVSADKKEGKVQVTVQPDPGAPSGDQRWVVFLRDVTLEETLHIKYQGELKDKEKYIDELRRAQAALEDYSKNLEKMVELRTSEVRAANQVLAAMVNCLGQGFVMFGPDFKCHPTYSLACETMFETNPARKPIYEVLGLKADQVADFRGWAETLFQEPIPFSDLARFGPQQFLGTHQRHIKIDYHPVRDDQGAVVGIVVVGTDKTQEILAGQEAERNRAYANMILKLSKNRGQFLTFIQEAQQMVRDLKLEVAKKDENPSLDYIFRVMHTLKGCAAVFSISEIQELAHKYESRLQELKDLSTLDQSVFNTELVDYAEQIESALNRFLAENKTLIGEAGMAGERAIEVSVKKLRDFSKRFLDGKDPAAHKAFSKTFLEEPIELFFAHVDEIVGPIATRQGKEIFPVKIVGGDLRINSDHYSELFQVLVHAFRNAVDHGLEVPERRVEAAKQPRGQITLEFARESRSGIPGLSIKVIDDGFGIDPEVIREKLKSKLPDKSFDGESDEQVIYHIFDSGFSTRTEVTDISGRGIGMDAIRSVVLEMGGALTLKSQVRIGTELWIWVPDQSQESNPVEGLRSA